MSEMVERVARAMCEKAGTDWSDTSGDEYAPALINRPFWMQQARAAIEAMRAPTDRMALVYADPTEAEMYWQAMIDEALK